MVGAVAALDPARDWVLPQYREAVALGRYGPEVLRTYALYQRGHPAGGHFPAPIRVFPIQISLAAQIPHAVGLAWAMQLKGEAGVACVFFGDGASSEGDFYEAGNFAGVLGAPVLFLCVNNGWAISTPLQAQTAATSFAAKAAAFGFPGVRVDGNDALAMIAVVAAARERAVTGGGPTLIEAVTFRMGPHTTADDPKRYQAPEERAAWEGPRPDRPPPPPPGRAGPVGRRAPGRRRSRRPPPRSTPPGTPPKRTTVAPDHFFDHVYAEPTPRMKVQRAELRDRLGLDADPGAGGLSRGGHDARRVDQPHPPFGDGARRARPRLRAGRRPQRGRLPGHRWAARPLRREAGGRHAAVGGRHHRDGRRPGRRGDDPGARDPVPRVLVAGVPSARRAAGPAPLPVRRPLRLPGDGACAVRRWGAHTRAALRGAGGAARAVPGPEGGAAGVGGRRQGPAGVGHSRSRPRHVPRAAQGLPAGEGRRPRGRAPRAAGEGQPRADGRRRRADRLERPGGGGPQGGGRARRRTQHLGLRSSTCGRWCRSTSRPS